MSRRRSTSVPPTDFREAYAADACRDGPDLPSCPFCGGKVALGQSIHNAAGGYIARPVAWRAGSR